MFPQVLGKFSQLSTAAISMYANEIEDEMTGEADEYATAFQAFKTSARALRSFSAV